MDIDDSFYNRQRYVLGDEAMRAMSKASVYLYGLRGLGLEVAKNLVLGGIHELYLDDRNICSVDNQGSQFYIANDDICHRRTRAEASISQISQLNPYVKVCIPQFTIDSLVEVMSNEKNKDILKELERFSCIIVTDCDLIHIGIINNFCRANDIKFIIADVYGLFGIIFCDFGESFTIDAENDEENMEFFIGFISNEKNPILKVLNDESHGLSNGDLITFKGIDGMQELNGKECEITVISRSMVRLKIDTSKYGTYTKNGVCIQRKRHKSIHFGNFFDQSFKPTIINPDFCRLEYSRCLQLFYLALKKFYLNESRMPHERNEADYLCIKSLLDMLTSSIEYEFTPHCWRLVKTICNASSGELQPLNALFGGIAAQEVIKAVTHKFTPIQQWFVMECQSLSSDAVDTNTTKGRYESLRKCIGRDLIEKLHRLRIFMVGCGAIGCELLKNMAMLGVSASPNKDELINQINNCGNKESRIESCGDGSYSSTAEADDELTVDGVEPQYTNTTMDPHNVLPEVVEHSHAKASKQHSITKESSSSQRSSCNDSLVEDCGLHTGKIIVTDNDLIEKSNLNRQFLFKHNHIKQPKSVIARQSVMKINPELNIEANQHLVGPSTENIYNDKFFQNIDICLNALDNIEGRRYMDSRCVINQKSLIESGTMSTKGHVQVIIPHKTENYSNQSDPQEIEIPYCTLKSFPAKIEHCIEWAREKFELNFYMKPCATNRCLHCDGINIPSSNNYNSDYDDLVKALKVLKKRPKSFKDCVQNVRIKFELNFNHKAQQLLHSFPIDTRLDDGSLFWQLPKRAPEALIFDIDNSLHWLFILSYSKIIAIVYGIESQDVTIEEMRQWVSEVHAPIFTPNNRPIEIDENVKRDDKKSDEIKLADMEINDVTMNLVKLRGEQESIQVFPIEFEKDNILHIDFITALSNLRAQMYGIDQVDACTVKKISGRIIPAIATTTSVIAGLAMIELLKVVKNLTLNDYRNSFINLSLSQFVLSEPGNCQIESIVNNNGDFLSYSIWDHWEVIGNSTFTVNDLIHDIEKQKGLTSNMILQGNRIVYLNILPGSQNKLDQKLSSLLMLQEGDSYVDLLVSYGCSKSQVDNGEDIKGPLVRYWVKKFE